MGSGREEGCAIPFPGSEWAASSCADIHEEPVSSGPPCVVQAEEEAVYEEPPEQETLYEEPPVVSSPQQGLAVKGSRTQKCSLSHASHGMPDFSVAPYMRIISCNLGQSLAVLWEVMGGGQQQPVSL